MKFDIHQGYVDTINMASEGVQEHSTPVDYINGALKTSL